MEIKIIHSSDINFSYRGCSLENNLIFISATFRGKNHNKNDIEKTINNLTKKKNEDQPTKIKTCGSTFKNPKNNKAWQLIKDSGSFNMKVGDAVVSKKHCNFLVNEGKATSKDLESLIDQIKDKVFKKTGISLDLELQIIGEKL